MLVQSDMLGGGGNKRKKQEYIGRQMNSCSAINPTTSDELYGLSAHSIETCQLTHFKSLDLDIFRGKVEFLRDDNVDHFPGV